MYAWRLSNKCATVITNNNIIINTIRGLSEQRAKKWVKLLSAAILTCTIRVMSLWNLFQSWAVDCNFHVILKAVTHSVLTLSSSDMFSTRFSAKLITHTVFLMRKYKIASGAKMERWTISDWLAFCHTERLPFPSSTGASQKNCFVKRTPQIGNSSSFITAITLLSGKRERLSVISCVVLFIWDVVCG